MDNSELFAEIGRLKLALSRRGVWLGEERRSDNPPPYDGPERRQP
jgi:hypothetical protein